MFVGGPARARQGAAFGQAQAAQPELGIGSGSGPAAAAFQRAAAEGLAPAFVGSGPEPGENHVDGQLVQPLTAEQRAGSGLSGGEKVEAAFPKGVFFGLKEFGERGAQLRTGDVLRQPALDPPGQLRPPEPMSGQGEAAVRVVGRAQPAERPDGFRERASGPPALLPPPRIPQRAGEQAFLGLPERQVPRQQPGQAEETGLEPRQAWAVFDQLAGCFA